MSLCSFPILFVMTRAFRSRAELAYRATREAVALVIVHFVESLGGIQAVHAFRREPRNQEIFEHLDDRYRRANNWSGRLAGIYGPGVQLVGRLTIAVVLFVGSLRVLDGDMTVGVLAAFLLYLRRFFAPMEELSQFYNLFQAAAAAIEKLSGVLAEEPSVPEPVEPTPLPHAQGEVRFEGVEFGYRERTVLHHLDLTIPAGQTLAVVGATGAGKTTIARLAARFWDPTDGARPARRHRPPRPHRGRPAPGRHHRHPGELPVRRLGGRQHRARPPRRRPATRSRPPPAPSAPTSSSPRCPTATTPTCTRRAPACRPASASWCRSPAPSSPTPPC